MGAGAVPTIRDDYLFRRGGVHGGSRRHRGLGWQRSVARRPSARSQKVSSNDDRHEPLHHNRFPQWDDHVLRSSPGRVQAARPRETPQNNERW